MTEDGNQVSGVEREPTARQMPYEVAGFVRKHGLSMVETRSLIKKVGNDCTKLDEAAKKLERH